MNTQDQPVPRLRRLTPSWGKLFWYHLKQDVDVYAAIPNTEGRRFSVWQAEHVVAEPAIELLGNLYLNLKILRNFRLDPLERHATLLHRDHPSNPCFAVNICVRGSMRVHFYPEATPVVWNQTDCRGNTSPVYSQTVEPTESYDVSEGELFIMDTSTIHQADTSECSTPVVLLSFVPKPQYRYEEALERLEVAVRTP